MSEKPKTPTESLAGSYQFYLFLFSMFAIAMGLARHLGRSHWEEVERALRKDQNLPVATLLSPGESAFTYSSLLQGGLLSLALVSWLCLYIAFMLVFIHWRGLLRGIQSDPAAVLRSVSILALYPILMMPVYIYQSFRPHFDKLHLGYLVGFSLAVAVAAAVGLAPIRLAQSVRTKIAMAAVSLTAMALLASYATGQREGIEAADPTTSAYVAVKMTDGSVLRGWLYEATGSDYRLVTKDGSNVIVPASGVREIKELVPGGDAESPATPTSPAPASPAG